MKNKLDKTQGGIIVKRGANEIFVPSEYLKPNGKIKREGKKMIESQLALKSSRRVV